ncbi:hypothetical protein YC2023_100261 [Brassica napus]
MEPNPVYRHLFSSFYPNPRKDILYTIRKYSTSQSGLDPLVSDPMIQTSILTGMDYVVWVRFGMGTMTVDGSWTSLECMWVFFMLVWLVEVSCFNRRSARTIGSLWRITRWYQACIIGFWCRCYYGLLGESRKVASWVGAEGVDTQAQSMWRDKIEFRFSFIKVFIWEMQGRIARDMNCVSLNTFIYLMGWQCWREYSHDGWNVVSRLLGFEGITVPEKVFNRGMVGDDKYKENHKDEWILAYGWKGKQ